MGVSKNNGTPKSSMLIDFSTINHPFWVPLCLAWKHPYIQRHDHILLRNNSATFRWAKVSSPTMDPLRKVSSAGVLQNAGNSYASDLPFNL